MMPRAPSVNSLLVVFALSVAVVAAVNFSPLLAVFAAICCAAAADSVTPLRLKQMPTEFGASRAASGA